jgi:Protein of unknown function (DUF2867)
MSTSVQAVHPPKNSRIAQRLASELAQADFFDAWAVEALHPELSALDQYLRAARSTPGWVAASMRFRNWVVGRLGLKNLGDLAGVAPDRHADAYQPGDRVGIFTLLENQPSEVLLGDDDKHLRVALSVHTQATSQADRALVTVTTVVHTHNAWGKLYMLPVAPMHKRIVPAMLKHLA